MINICIVQFEKQRKSMIVPSLLPSDAGVLGFTCHLHEFDSYGNGGSRVFNNNMSNELKFLFDW